MCAFSCIPRCCCLRRIEVHEIVRGGRKREGGVVTRIGGSRRREGRGWARIYQCFFASVFLETKCRVPYRTPDPSICMHSMILTRNQTPITANGRRERKRKKNNHRPPARLPSSSHSSIPRGGIYKKKPGPPIPCCSYA